MPEPLSTRLLAPRVPPPWIMPLNVVEPPVGITLLAGLSPLCRPRGALSIGGHGRIPPEESRKHKSRVTEGTTSTLSLGSRRNNFGGLASLFTQAPWLCVPASRSVCLFELFAARGDAHLLLLSKT